MLELKFVGGETFRENKVGNRTISVWNSLLVFQRQRSTRNGKVKGGGKIEVNRFVRQKSNLHTGPLSKDPVGGRGGICLSDMLTGIAGRLGGKRQG